MQAAENTRCTPLFPSLINKYYLKKVIYMYILKGSNNLTLVFKTVLFKTLKILWIPIT